MNLKKYLVVSFILLSTLFPKVVDMQDVIKVSHNLISERAIDYYDIVNINLEKFENIEYFYIVHLNPQGFILISANKEFIPVLGYSFDNLYENDNIPSHYDYWLGYYADQIEYIIIEDLEIGSRWDILGNIIRKLDVGNYIRTEEQWYKLISSNFNILKNYRIRSFIPSYAVFVLSA